MQAIPSHTSVRSQNLVVEAAFEVCNQIGGIYTVLRSKAPTMVQRLGDRYCCLGPYTNQISPLEFERFPAEGPF